MIGETILHYKILEKLGESACRQAGAGLSAEAVKNNKLG
jgi:hypothetical protein